MDEKVFIEFERSEIGHVITNVDKIKHFRVVNGDMTKAVMDDGETFETGMDRRTVKYILGRISKKKDCPPRTVRQGLSAIGGLP